MDFARYSKNNWRDGSGGNLSGKLEYRIDGKRLLDAGYTKAEIERAVAELEQELNKNLGGIDVGNGNKTSFKVAVDFDPKPTTQAPTPPQTLPAQPTQPTQPTAPTHQDGGH